MAEVFSFSLFPFSFLGFLIDIEMEIEGAKFGGVLNEEKEKDGNGDKSRIYSFNSFQYKLVSGCILSTAGKAAELQKP